VASFDQYLRNVGGPKVVCGDDPIGARLAAEHGATTYGTSEGVDVRAVDVRATHGTLTFAIEQAGAHLVDISLPQRGMHNVRNATAALAMAFAIGVAPAVAAAALAKFGGVARRFDIRGVDRGATFVDDYAHLPSEITAVLDAARRSDDGWRRVVAVFQPNRYNRIAEMWADYGDSFGDADVVVLTEIYSSGTQPIPGVTGRLIVNAVLDHAPFTRVAWLPKRDDLVTFLAGEVRDGDVCISMGCGDIATLPDEVLAARRGSPVR